jgi:hypothetical protein
LIQQRIDLIEKQGQQHTQKHTRGNNKKKKRKRNKRRVQDGEAERDG